MMKVLIATGLYPPQMGGPATHAVLLERELPLRGFEIRMLPFSSVLWLPPGFRHALYFLRLLFRAPGVSIIYALDPVSVGLPAFLVAKMLRKKFILRVAGDYAWEQGVARFGVVAPLDVFVTQLKKQAIQVRLLAFIEYFVAYYASHVIVPSEYLKRIVTAWGVNVTPITVVYNAYTPTPIDEDKAALRDALQYHGIVVMSAGRLVPWKGFRVLIDVIKELHSTFPEINLVIAGDGPEQAELAWYAKEKGIGAHVSFAGNLPRKELSRAIKGADMFVLNTGYEGFSHLSLEVMALGVPVVTTHVGGNPELITHEKEGLLVPYDDATLLKEAILRLIKEPLLRESLTLDARERATSFTTARMAEGIAGVMKRCV